MRVSKFSYITVALIFTSFAFLNLAQAQIPVTDAGSVKQGIKGTINSIKEAKIVKDSVAFAGKTSAAIGDAKKSVTEYVIKNKEKVEKKLEKVEKYKKRAEKYKKEYDEYKALYEEKKAEAEAFKADVEKGVADAKQMKADAEEGVATAKGMAASAKDMAAAGKDMAQSKIDGAKDKAGISNSSSDSSQSPVSDASGNVGTSNVDASDAGVNQADATAGVLPDAASSTTAPTRQPFASAENNSAVANVSNTPTVDDGTSTGSVSDTLKKAISDATQGTSNNTLGTVAPLQKNVVAAPSSNSVNSARATVSNNGVSTQKLNKQGLVINYPAVQDININTQNRVNSSGLRVKTPSRTNFKTMEKRSSLQNSSFASISNIVPMAFASILNLPDGGTNSEGDMIIPSALAMSCQINSKDAYGDGVVDACLVRINDMQKRSQLGEAEDGGRLYKQGLRYYSAAYIAEAIKAKNDSEEFVSKVVDPVGFAITTTETDDYANIVEMNKAVVTTVNNLLKIYSAKLALDTYQNYGNYKFASPEDVD